MRLFWQWTVKNIRIYRLTAYGRLLESVQTAYESNIATLMNEVDSLKTRLIKHESLQKINPPETRNETPPPPVLTPKSQKSNTTVVLGTYSLDSKKWISYSKITAKFNFVA